MPRRKAPTQTQVEDGDEQEDFNEQLMEMDDADGAGNVSGGRKQRGSRGSGAASGPALSAEDIEKKANELCRLALFSEYKRSILKREEINKKVMGGISKAFPEVLAKANKRLRAAVGCEIVELMSKEEREKTIVGAAANDESERKKKGTSKQYIVRSILEPELINLACAPDREILEQEQEDQAYDGAKPSGTILAWESYDNIPTYGILCVILSLILVNGKTLPEPSLKKNLKKLRLFNTTIIETGPSAAPKAMSFDNLLMNLVKQGYLERIKVGASAGPKGNKRGRGGLSKSDNLEDAADHEWRWGERAHAEISEQGISDFIVSFMMDRSRPVGNIQESERVKKERLEKLQKQLTKDVSRAAQTKLTTIEIAD
ncbi:hypothetical protein FRC18_009622 [Serendipita sp. 400]|nr:hypothetical protein FRC18_009622 [Serendipita sp. 400]